MKTLFFCIDDAQPCLSQCRACAETIAVNNAWDAERRDRLEREQDDSLNNGAESRTKK
jgi:hypothetical protein